MTTLLFCRLQARYAHVWWRARKEGFSAAAMHARIPESLWGLSLGPKTSVIKKTEKRKPKMDDILVYCQSFCGLIAYFKRFRWHEVVLLGKSAAGGIDLTRWCHPPFRHTTAFMTARNKEEKNMASKIHGVMFLSFTCQKIIRNIIQLGHTRRVAVHVCCINHRLWSTKARRKGVNTARFCLSCKVVIHFVVWFNCGFVSKRIAFPLK